jgi:hypothetical protein
MRTDWHSGIRDFCDHWRDAPMLQQTLQTLEVAFDQGNDTSIDAAKCIVECACQVLIRELDDPANPIKGWKDSPIRDENPNFKNWVSAAFKLLNITEGRDDLFSKVVSQHYKLTEELGNFRNRAGPVSHGKDGFARRLSDHHRRSALLAADAIVSFLHNAYLERVPDPVRTMEPYDRFEDANRRIDRAAAIRVIGVEEGFLQLEVGIGADETIPLSISPSLLLFGVDREAFKLAMELTAGIVLDEAPELAEEPQDG